MKFIAMLAAIFALSQTALAQTSDCKSIADTTARLACYDKAAPAGNPALSRTSATTKAGAKPDAGKYIDSISAEDALMNARLKNICRGC